MHTFNNTGEYDVVLTVTDNNNCTAMYNDSVLVSPNVKAAFTFDTVCSGNTTIFSDNSTITANSTIDQWSWNFGDGTSLIYVNKVNPVKHTYNVSGIYKVTLIATGNNGVSDSCFHLYL